MKLSVVIPAYNRHELTARHVAECLKSTRVPDEIVIVNDGGPENLRDLLLPMAGKVPIIYGRVEEDILWNYGGCVNLAVWIATGDIIAIEDTDHIPFRDTYEVGLRTFEENPGIERVAFNRRIVDIKDCMANPMEKWQITGKLGTNQMVAMMTRMAYIRLKGQDERMAGRYGYLSYDFPYRRDKLLGVKSIKQNMYWAVFGDQGEPGLKRGLHPKNRSIYHENVNAGKLHSAYGILNFHFRVERL